MCSRWVGLIPLFACEIVDQRLLTGAPRFRAVLERAQRRRCSDGNYVSACPTKTNERGEHLLALVDHTMLQARSCSACWTRSEFLSRYGVRSVVAHPRRAPGSRHAARHRPGADRVRAGRIELGPVRRQLQLARADLDADQLHADPGDREVPPLPRRRLQGRRCRASAISELTLNEIAKLISDRLVTSSAAEPTAAFRRCRADSPFQRDPHWQDLLLFNEYFHGETGLGLGAMHQTGWTGLVANLVQRHYRKDIPAFWRGQRIQEAAE